MQIESVAYTHTLKELALNVNTQQAITRDNVTIRIDGVLYIRIVDAFKASYGVDRPLYAVMQLAQTSMRSELGKMTLDNTFEERDTLNEKIVQVRVAARWGASGGSLCPGAAGVPCTARVRSGALADDGEADTPPGHRWPRCARESACMLLAAAVRLYVGVGLVPSLGVPMPCHARARMRPMRVIVICRMCVCR